MQYVVYLVTIISIIFPFPGSLRQLLLIDMFCVGRIEGRNNGCKLGDDKWCVGRDVSS